MRRSLCYPHHAPGFGCGPFFHGPAQPSLGGVIATSIIGATTDILCTSILENNCDNYDYNGIFVNTSKRTYNVGTTSIYTSSPIGGVYNYDTYIGGGSNYGGTNLYFNTTIDLRNGTVSSTTGSAAGAGGGSSTVDGSSGNDDDKVKDNNKVKDDDDKKADDDKDDSKIKDNNDDGGDDDDSPTVKKSTKVDASAFNNAIDDLDDSGNEKLYSGVHHNSSGKTQDTTSKAVADTANETEKQKIKDGIKRGKADGKYNDGENENTKTDDGYYRYITLTDKDSGNEYTYEYVSSGSEGLKYKLLPASSKINENSGWKLTNKNVAVTVSIEDNQIKLTSNGSDYSATKGKASGGGASSSSSVVVEEKPASETKTAAQIGQDIYDIADNNSGGDSVKKMNNYIQKNITSDNVIDVLESYKNVDTGDSSLFDTITSEWLGYGEGHGRDNAVQAHKYIMNKLLEAADNAGVDKDCQAYKNAKTCADADYTRWIDDKALVIDNNNYIGNNDRSLSRKFESLSEALIAEIKSKKTAQ